MYTPKQQQRVVSDSGNELDSDEYMYAVKNNQNTGEGQPNRVKALNVATPRVYFYSEI